MANPNELIDEMIAQTTDWRGEMLARLRAVIHDADPEIVEEVKWKRPSNPMGAPVWEHDGIVCVGNILKERVRLTLFDGPRLPDPKGLFNARLDSNAVRAIDFYEGDTVNAVALRALIRSAVKHKRAKGNSSSRRGRAAVSEPRSAGRR